MSLDAPFVSAGYLGNNASVERYRAEHWRPGKKRDQNRLRASVISSARQRRAWRRTSAAWKRQ
jgi:hypothetical protein